MVWIARLLLFIPSLVAGWFVSQEDPRYWVIALAIGLTFLALGIIGSRPSMWCNFGAGHRAAFSGGLGCNL
ncbi:hypothetical protein [Sphingobium yanoikuyae]|uniref:hypothetical protein n=1 Tax=Sphingobium yanoikuyae TaxID=13690 RepID=UPI0035C74A2F